MDDVSDHRAPPKCELWAHGEINATTRNAQIEYWTTELDERGAGVVVVTAAVLDVVDAGHGGSFRCCPLVADVRAY